VTGGKLQARKEIRTLLGVLASSITVAIGMSALLLYVYSPTGNYMAANVILAPHITKDLYFSEKNNKKLATWLDHVEYQFWDLESHSWKQSRVDEGLYAQFYQLIAQKESIDPQSNNVSALFEQKRPTSLWIFTQSRSSDNLQGTPRIFQTIQFAEQGDYFRVELHTDRRQDQSPHEQWAYFYSPQILHKMTYLFSSTERM